MKRILLCLSLFTAPGILSAQTLNWANQYTPELGSARILRTAMSPNGDIVSTGKFNGTLDFDPSSAVYELESFTSIQDYFIMRNAPDGSLISVIHIIGNHHEVVPLAVDSENNSITLSIFNESFDFDPSSGVAELNPSEARNLALTKYDVDGALIWAKQFGSTQYMDPKALTTDAAGNIYASMIISSDLHFDSQELYSGLSTTTRSVILKINPSGSLTWHGLLNENTRVNEIAISPSGKLYTVGGFFGTSDFDFGESEFPLTASGSWDAFMSIYNTDGSHSDAFRIGKGQYDQAHNLAFYPNNDVVMVGEYLNQIDCTPNGIGNGLNTAGAKDGSFIAKYDSELNLVWQKQIGFSADTYNTDVAIDSEGNVCTVGWFGGTANFDPLDTYVNQGITSAYRDGFISKLNSDGEYIFGGAFSGASDSDYAATIVAGENGALYIGGAFGLTTDIDPGDEEYILTGTTSENGFLIKMDDFAVSVPRISENISLIAFPNPSVGVFTIKSSEYLKSNSILVYNILGERIDADITTYESQFSVEIDGAKGIYLLEILWADGTRSVTKLVKE